MADLTKTIEILFGADTSKLDAALRGTTAGIGKFSSGLTTTASNIGVLAGSLLAVEAAVARVAIAFIASGVQSALKYQGAVQEMNKALENGVEITKEQELQVEKLALAYGNSTSDVLDSVTDFVKGGNDMADSLTLTENAMKFALTTELDLEGSTRLLKQAMAALGIEVDGVLPFFDKINKVADTSSANADQLAEAIAASGATFKQLGFSLDETIAYLTPVVEAMQEGSESGRGLKSALGSLAAPTGELLGLLGQLGTNQDGVNISTLRGKDLFLALLQIWPSLNKQMQDNLGFTIAGKDQANRFFAVMDAGEKSLRHLETAQKSANTTNEQMAIQFQKTEQQIQILVNGFDTISQKIGAGFLPNIDSSVRALNELEMAFIDVINDGGLEPLFRALDPLFADFTETVKGIAKALPEAFKGVDFSPIITALNGIADEVKGVFEGLDPTKPEELRKIINQIIEAIGGFITATKATFGLMLDLADAVAQIAIAWGKLGETGQAAVGVLLGLGIAAGTLRSGLGLLGTALDLIRKHPLIAGGILVGTGIYELSQVFKTAGENAQDLSSDTYDAAKAAEAAKPWWQKLGEAVGLLESDASATANQFDALGQAADKAATDTAKLGGASTKAAEDLSHLDVAAQAITADMGDTSPAMQKVLDDIDDLATGAGKAEGAVDKFGGGLNQIAKGSAPAAAGSPAVVDDKYRKLVEVVRDADGKVIGYKQSTEATTNALDAHKKKADEVKGTYSETTDRIVKLVDAQNNFMVKIREIDAELQGKIITAKFELEAARVEADARRVEAAFDSVGRTVEATAQAASDMFASLAGGNDLSLSQWNKLYRVLQDQMKLQQQAVETQKQLVDAQIQYMNARTRAISRGDALIKISADGLDTLLQQFMLQIIQNIQVKANAEGQAFLLGCG